MPNIGPTELIVILVIALLVLGPKKLPEVGRSIGRGIREFKDGISSSDAHANDAELPHGRARSAQVTAAAPPLETPVASHSATADDR